VDIALTLLQSSARAIVAGDRGTLVGELRTFGGEWLPMSNGTFNPLHIRRNARQLAKLITADRPHRRRGASAGASWRLPPRSESCRKTSYVTAHAGRIAY